MSGPVNPTPQKDNAYVPIRRFRVLELVPPAFGGKGSLIPSPGSLFKSLHPGLKEMAVCLAVYLGLGTIIFSFFLDDLKGKKTNPMIDAMYFSVVTMTTVGGYGDLEPNTTFIKVVVCIFVLIGMALMGLISSKIGDYFVEKLEIMLVNAQNNKQEKGSSSKTMMRLGISEEMFNCLIAMGILSALMMVGTMFLFAIEDLNMIDALFCVCSTVSTLGYGDKSFSTKGGRLFGVVWILSTTFGLGQFFLYVAETFVEGRQKALVNRILNWRMANQDVEAVHVDVDEVAGAAEFIISKLKERGKINQEDISRAVKEFEDLDVAKSGFLSVSDLMPAKTTQTKR
ncbi:two-pore potassium channel 1 [Jatropha curcas]|uniref:two-pore potassium channel 1 n=1 Tax=Jatropha curcas TaxID=180498 RepID=UPI0005FBE442|nr:two-pore potassium channel 1 [Jatropha curcas]